MNFQYHILTKCLIFFSAFTLINSTYAFSEKPTACPGAKAIQEEGLLGVLPYLKNRYMVYNTSSFGTTSHWMFYMGPINANSDENALKMGKKLLSTLSGAPFPEGHDGDWFCKYKTTNQAIMAVASVSGFSFSKLE